MNVVVYSPWNMLILFLEWKQCFFFCVHVSYINSIGNKFLNVEGGDIYNSTDQ
jgi:hypothetical protein